MSWSWAPYKSVAERKEDAAKTIAKLQKKGQKLSPVKIEVIKIASSFWGKAWCKHLESFSDYQSRLPRGRSYVRHGAVINLDITNRSINALVLGSELYKVNVQIKAVPNTKWQTILNKCAGEISTVIEILQGKFSSSVMATIIDKNNGLFPLAEEIEFKCSCYDWANMCKHVAAVLYGIGARLDSEPELIFMLRDVDHTDLLNIKIVEGASLDKQEQLIDTQDLSELFGIDIDMGTVKSSKITAKTSPNKKQKQSSNAINKAKKRVAKK